MVGVCALALALPFFGVPPRWSLLWVPVVLATLFAFTFAVALCVSAANLLFRDVKYIVQVVLMFGIFFTPIFFEPAMLGATGARLVMLNPVAPLVEGLRLAIVQGHNLLLPLEAVKAGRAVVAWSPWYLVASATWAFGGLGVTSILFHRLEFKFAEWA
jgi:lipopolysaccharide transport system permease protein